MSFFFLIQVCQLHGKVLFSSSAAIHRITGLKAAERLFLLLKKDSPLRMPTRCSRGTSPTDTPVLKYFIQLKITMELAL